MQTKKNNAPKRVSAGLYRDGDGKLVKKQSDGVFIDAAPPKPMGPGVVPKVTQQMANPHFNPRDPSTWKPGKEIDPGYGAPNITPGAGSQADTGPASQAEVTKIAGDAANQADQFYQPSSAPQYTQNNKLPGRYAAEEMGGFRRENTVRSYMPGQIGKPGGPQMGLQNPIRIPQPGTPEYDEFVKKFGGMAAASANGGALY